MANPENSAERNRFPIEKLLQPAAFPHPVSRLTVMETHISWIVLTGKFAYKIKKPVAFDFVDYSTLEHRRLNCEKEVVLNQRYSEGIYLEVVPIVQERGQFRIGDPGQTEPEPLEYAVKMTEFSQENILAHQLKESEIPVEQMDQFAATLADFHQRENPIEINDLDEELNKIHAEVTDNFKLLGRSLRDTAQMQTLRAIENWSEEKFQRLSPRIRQRIAEGCVKKCHGDLHLNNIINFEGRLVPFDGIEFNEHLQNIDTLNEVAFPFMDLLAHGYDPHAWRLLNAYLEIAGEYRDLELLRFFAVYRAMVRAKVAWIHCQVKSSTSGHQSSWLKGDAPAGADHHHPAHPWDHYLEFAERNISPPQPRLWITFGFSGSGKSTRALEVVESKGAVRLRSDAVRQNFKKRGLQQPLYSNETTDDVYRQLLTEAQAVLEAGYSAVVDATFLARYHRNWFRNLAEHRGIEFGILACDASFGELCARIRQRTNDPSEATIAVLQQQMEKYDPLSEDELERTAEPLKKS